MSIAEFTSTVQSKAFKTWLSSLNNNIINKSVDELRKGQITATKTDFLLTKKTLKKMFESLSGSTAEDHDIDLMFQELAGKLNTLPKGSKVGNLIAVNGNEPALLYESINFDTISTIVKKVLLTPDVEVRLHELSLVAQEKAKKELDIKYGSRKDVPPEEFRKADSIEITMGDFFDKGHVVSIATNLGKEFEAEINNASGLTSQVKSTLTTVLRQYIDELERADLASANLPNAINQTVYAKYIKSHDKYLVEFQIASYNQSSGRASILPVTELRALFKAEEGALVALANSPALGKALLTTQGSPSYIDLVALNLVETISKKKTTKKVYTIPSTKVLSNKTPIKKPKSNKKEIAAAERLLSSIKKAPKSKNLYSSIAVNIPPLTTSLDTLLRTRLADQIKSNMGTGNAKNVLNYRTGRFANTATIERTTTSRARMVSVFYNYMRNPYGTFSEGGQQQFPKSRDPKLLISKSIREIGAQLVGNRMRAILV